MKKRLLPILPLSLLAACGGWSNPIARLDPHRVEVQQGNLVTQEMLAQLKPGMTASQVRFALGTPLLVDPFHADRWDYVFSVQRGGKQVERRRITVVFEHERLKGVEGDLKASGAPAAQPAPEAKP